MTELGAPVICLMGPTASGKTQVALRLVQHFPFEIISVDSAMVYCGMDIGTAKPDPDLLRQFPHHLVNIRDPGDAYSAAQFSQDALREIKKIFLKGKIPLLVGGTMLYFRTLQHGIAPMPSADPALRVKLHEDGRQLGWPVMHQRLELVDPTAAARIHPHDSQRIQRALEVYVLTGKNLTAWQKDQGEVTTDFELHHLIIAPQDRAILHERIAERFTTMLQAGLIDEVKKLFDRGDLTLDTPAMRSVGYRQVWEYLQGKYTVEAMCEKGIIATRQLAKRQLTWLRRWPNAMWFDSEADNLPTQISDFLQNILLSRR